jgi:hypothetical protein
MSQSTGVEWLMPGARHSLQGPDFDWNQPRYRSCSISYAVLSLCDYPVRAKLINLASSSGELAIPPVRVAPAASQIEHNMK